MAPEFDTEFNEICEKLRVQASITSEAENCRVSEAEICELKLKTDEILKRADQTINRIKLKYNLVSENTGEDTGGNTQM
jgi:uncharacterized beta-barrel protein YwiB (DUF1934 family)